MFRNLLALTAVLALQATALEAGASCTAGRPVSSLIESTPTSAFTNHGEFDESSVGFFMTGPDR